jgi:hypothetical protein
MAISNSSVEIGKNVIELLQNISNNSYGNMSNISNSSHHTDNDKDDSSDLEPYIPLIGAGIAILFYICLFGLYKLCTLDCDCGKCCKQSCIDFRDALCDCFFCFKPCFTKINNVSICIRDIWCDYWCPLPQPDVYNNDQLLQDPNYLHIYIESIREKEKKENKIINFEEKNLILPQAEENICSICLEIIDNNNLVSTPCDHYFCQGCIEKYLNDGHDDCPNCRASINNTLYKDSPV